MSKHRPGACYMVPSWAFCCARCQDFFDSYNNTREAAIKDARQAGWSNTKDGWMCPTCVAAKRTKEEQP
jgi:hypothetical protein